MTEAEKLALAERIESLILVRQDAIREALPGLLDNATTQLGRILVEHHEHFLSALRSVPSEEDIARAICRAKIQRNPREYGFDSFTSFTTERVERLVESSLPYHRPEARAVLQLLTGKEGPPPSPVTAPGRAQAALLQNYRNLGQGVRMIREAVEQVYGASLLPAGEHTGPTPIHECEAIAKAIYAAADVRSPVASDHLVDANKVTGVPVTDAPGRAQAIAGLPSDWLHREVFAKDEHGFSAGWLACREAAAQAITARGLDGAPVTIANGVYSRSRLDAIAIIRSLTPPASAWREIETAPKDGSFVLLFSPKGGRQIAFYEERTILGHPAWFAPIEEQRVGGGAYTYDPTHWQPLPSPPEAGR